jgi:hypothetical protein
MCVSMCACFVFCHFWTHKAKVIEFSAIFFVTEFSVKIDNWVFHNWNVCFHKNFEIKATSTEIVLGWVTLQKCLIFTLVRVREHMSSTTRK